MSKNCIRCGIQFEEGTSPSDFCHEHSPVGKPFFSFGKEPVDLSIGENFATPKDIARTVNENQAGEKQAQEWPEPLCVGATVEKGYADATFANVAIHVGEPSNKGNCVAMVHLGGAGGTKSDRKSVERFAAHIVDCVNEFKGVNKVEGFINSLHLALQKQHEDLLSNDDAIRLLRAEVARLTEACNKEFSSVEKLDTENVMLRQQKFRVAFGMEAAGFRDYVHELTGNEGEDDALTVLKSYVVGLRTELATLRQEKEKNGNTFNELSQIRYMLERAEQERDQYKAAWDWVRKHGQSVHEKLVGGKSVESIEAAELRAILASDETHGGSEG